MKADHESRAARVDHDFTERAAQLLINQPVISMNRSGGITAHTISAQTVNVYAAEPSGDLARAQTLREASSDSPIWKAIQHVALCIGEPKDTTYFPRARALIRQAALDRKLIIRGRKQLEDHPSWLTTRKFSEVLADIPPVYWRSSKINPYASVEQDHVNNPYTLQESQLPEPQDVGNKNTAYADLRVTEHEVMSLWPEPSRRMPILDLLTAAEADAWVFRGRRNAPFEFTQGVRQAAREGLVEIWGIDLETSWDIKSAPSICTSEKIAPDYFKEHWVEVHQGWMHKENAYTRTSRPSGDEPRYYSDLHVDRVQALIWLGGDARRIKQRVDSGPE